MPDLCYSSPAAWCRYFKEIDMAESNKVFKFELSADEFGLIQTGLTMLKTSRLRAVQAEVDAAIREVRVDSAGKIAALQVKLSNVK